MFFHMGRSTEHASVCSVFLLIISSISSLMRNLLLNGFIIYLIIGYSPLLAQVKAITENGENVTLNDDGTWEYSTFDSNEIESDETNYDCGSLISKTVDKVTGTSTIASKETLVISSDGGKTGFGIIMMKASNTVIVSIQAVGAGSCISDDDKMNVLFRDGTRFQVTNDGKFNCDPRFTLYLGGGIGKKKHLDLLKSKEIETIRIWTSDSFVEKDLSIEEGKMFMNMISCLSEI